MYSIPGQMHENNNNFKSSINQSLHKIGLLMLQNFSLFCIPTNSTAPIFLQKQTLFGKLLNSC